MVKWDELLLLRKEDYARQRPKQTAVKTIGPHVIEVDAYTSIEHAHGEPGQPSKHG
jgi:hypothetical protein